MSKIIGTCGKCSGRVIELDPLADWTLYAVFGEYMAEHREGCPDRPKLRTVSLGEL